MQHITMADKSLLVGDSATELLLRYAALLGKIGSADTVKVHAISGDGDEVVASFLLNAGTVMLAETSRSPSPEPDNDEVEGYLQGRLNSYEISEVDLISIDMAFPDEDEA